MAEIRSRVADRRAREDRVKDTCLVEQEPRASMKRALASVPPDEHYESKRVNSEVELEAKESRADWFRHHEESPLSWWKGVVSKSDIAFFQARVTDAQRVSTFIHSLISVGLF